MCVSRIQRLLTAIVLGLTLYFFTLGAADFQAGASQSLNFNIAVILQSFVIIMMLVWGITNFCPSMWFLKKIFPPCEWEK